MTGESTTASSLIGSPVTDISPKWFLAESESFPRYLVSVRDDLMPQFSNQLKSVLLGMHRNPEGQRILRKMANTTKFDALRIDEEGLQRRLFDILPDGSAN